MPLFDEDQFVCPKTGEPCDLLNRKRGRKKPKKRKIKLDAWGNPIPSLKGPKLSNDVKKNWGIVQEYLRTHPDWKAGRLIGFIDGSESKRSKKRETKKRPPILYYSYLGYKGERRFNWVLFQHRIEDVRRQASMNMLLGYREHATFEEWMAAHEEPREKIECP